MGRPTLFTITLSGNNVVYFAGSNIEGKVVLELAEQKKVQGISIMLSAKAYVHYTKHESEGTGSDRESYTVYYADTQNIFNDVIIPLWGDGRTSQQIAAGKYEFPFKFQLPSDMVLPTSFESKHGYIRYSLTSRMQRPWKFDHVATRAITVNEVIDINTTRLLAPLSNSNEKTVCCLCCASGPISLAVTIDRAGYCPGESIAISVMTENYSSRKITAIRATLKRTVVYHGKYQRHTVSGLGRHHDHHGHHHGHHHSHNRHHHFHGIRDLAESKIIQRIQGPGIEAGGTSNWNNELLPIPAVVPTISNSCRILSLSYTLTVTLDIPNAIDLHVTIPLTIGNVPFKGSVHSGNTNAAYPPTESYQPVNSFPASSAPHNAYMPPPCLPQDGGFNYSTAYPPVNVGLDNYTMGETQYAPVYGFVTDYQFAPPSSNFEAVVTVQGGEE